MREMFRLFLVVLIFAGLSGGLLAAVRGGTLKRIEYQQLKFVKGPSLRQILEGCTNDPLVDEFKLTDGESARNFFVGVFDGQANTVALESFAKGFGGDIGVLLAVNVETDQIVGVAVTTHSETPGVGARAKTDTAFPAQFQGLPIGNPIRVRPDGGPIDAISGATITSRSVCTAVTESAEIYLRLKSRVVEKLKGFQA